MRSTIHFVPILTTVMAIVFAVAVLRRYRERRTGPHLLWWAAGLFLYGVGTFTEAAVTIFGWSPGLFRAWYISGALLGGAPLAQGTVYLLLPRRVAHRLTIALVTFIVVASGFVLASPIDLSLVEPHGLSGSVLAWQGVRGFSPFINTYALIFLVGGALWSAWRFRLSPAGRHRTIGNVLIAAGALMPAVGGMSSRLGHTEVLYAGEFVGLILIWAGYRANIRGSVGQPARRVRQPNALVVADSPLEGLAGIEDPLEA